MASIDQAHRIAIRKILKDDVKTAVFSALHAIGADHVMNKRDMVVLIKPNVLMEKPPESAATTHPAVVRAVIQWVKQFRPARIYVADSSNGFAPGRTKRSLRVSGIQAVCDEEGACAVAFEETPRQSYKVPNPLVLDEMVSSTLLKEADLVINVPKIKTHGQCVLTCSIKNMFGTLIIGNKSRTHARFPTVNQFSSALADIYSVSRPHLTVIDGYLCQEGRGPASGDVVKLDVVMAGYDPVALDTTVCKIIGLDPKKVVHLIKAQQKGLGTMDLRTVQVLGDEIEAVHRPFKIPLTAWVPFPVPQALTDYIARVAFRATVSFRREPCVRCGTCWQNCPTKAIRPPLELQEANTPVWEKSRCITCYCCAETCPHGAVDFRIDIPRNILFSWIGPSLLLLLVIALWALARLF